MIKYSIIGVIQQWKKNQYYVPDFTIDILHEKSHSQVEQGIRVLEWEVSVGPISKVLLRPPQLDPGYHFCAI